MAGEWNKKLEDIINKSIKETKAYILNNNPQTSNNFKSVKPNVSSSSIGDNTLTKNITSTSTLKQKATAENKQILNDNKDQTGHREPADEKLTPKEETIDDLMGEFDNSDKFFSIKKETGNEKTAIENNEKDNEKDNEKTNNKTITEEEKFKESIGRTKAMTRSLLDEHPNLIISRTDREEYKKSRKGEKERKGEKKLGN